MKHKLVQKAWGINWDKIDEPLKLELSVPNEEIKQMVRFSHFNPNEKELLDAGLIEVIE